MTAIEFSAPTSFGEFVRWFSELLFDDFHRITEDEAIARRLTRRASALSHSFLGITLLLASQIGLEAEARGLQYEGRADNLAEIRASERVQLIRVPDNPYDPNAVQILTQEGLDLGWIPREIARGLAGVMDEGRQVSATVAHVEPDAPRLLVHVQG